MDTDKQTSTYRSYSGSKKVRELREGVRDVCIKADMAPRGIEVDMDRRPQSQYLE